MSDRELKEQKAIKSGVAIEQYQYKFPEDERHFGFENVSKSYSLTYHFYVGFKHLLHKLSNLDTISLLAIPRTCISMETGQQRKILFVE